MGESALLYNDTLPVVNCPQMQAGRGWGICGGGSAWEMKADPFSRKLRPPFSLLETAPLSSFPVAHFVVWIWMGVRQLLVANCPPSCNLSPPSWKLSPPPSCLPSGPVFKGGVWIGVIRPSCKLSTAELPIRPFAQF